MGFPLPDYQKGICHTNSICSRAQVRMTDLIKLQQFLSLHKLNQVINVSLSVSKANTRYKKYTVHGWLAYYQTENVSTYYSTIIFYKKK